MCINVTQRLKPGHEVKRNSFVGGFNLSEDQANSATKDRLIEKVSCHSKTGPSNKTQASATASAMISKQTEVSRSSINFEEAQKSVEDYRRSGWPKTSSSR